MHVDVCEEIHDAIQALVIVVQGMLLVQTRRHHIDCFSQTRNHENVGEGNPWMIHTDNAAIRNVVFGDDAGLGAPVTLKLALPRRHATIILFMLLLLMSVVQVAVLFLQILLLCVLIITTFALAVFTFRATISIGRLPQSTRGKVQIVYTADRQEIVISDI